jgi:hypothetical protein
MEKDKPQLVRKKRSFVVAYCIITSLFLGFILPTQAILLACAGSSISFGFTLPFVWAFTGVMSVVIFIMQLVFGPIVITRKVVCKRCHTSRTLARIPFLVGGRRMPLCDCGGEFETALFWTSKPEGVA